MTDRSRCYSIRGRGEAYEQQRFFAHPLRVLNEIPDPLTETSARPRKLGLWPQTCTFKLPEDYCMVLRSSRYTIYPNRSLSPISLGNALAPGFALTGRGLRPRRVPRNFVGPLRGCAWGRISVLESDVPKIPGSSAAKSVRAACRFSHRSSTDAFQQRGRGGSAAWIAARRSGRSRSFCMLSTPEPPSCPKNCTSFPPYFHSRRRPFFFGLTCVLFGVDSTNVLRYDCDCKSANQRVMRRLC